MKKESFMNQEFVIDEEMLKKNISLTPEKKLKIMEEMREFFWINAPKETKELWKELKHIRIEDLD